jgi:S-adenosylmethionine:tRNA ribosyltransferase-isomerase
MMGRSMRVDLFDFDLPPECIALSPVSPRDAARMLVVQQDGLHDRGILDLPHKLRAGDLIVTNNTRVLPAQLFGSRPARGEGEPVSIEATLHKDLGDECWRAFVRPAKRLRAGDVIRFGEEFSATVISREGAEAVLDFEKTSEPFHERLACAGVMPLPPYIARRRPAGEDDKQNYQTIFAQETGSVAAPTAGLHFTDNLLELLRLRGVGQLSVTLHVGAGTFLPVTVDETDDHKMHSEWGEITQDQAQRINECRASGGRIIAVGTTSLRLLESAADGEGVIHPFAGETDIFITPGYRFKAAQMLLTNFHLPRSTLFMLICAFAGTEQMKAAYTHAIEQEYRFYSYGDACFLELNDER